MTIGRADENLAQWVEFYDSDGRGLAEKIPVRL
jgi:hypothetical protein